ncbi:2-oxoglutarate dehydrogenase, E2 component, dihydrolipoamide succinyltransferase [uncultured Arcanobacterium sp.]|uniref:2-oxoglutarate dehydrogenase, E2 component, dihydrolipoamide succinyltransferase n=1 Tax=uncultured Arcanobacterium sp. TaxID=487520 RepID=UPI00262E8323|nr:2-oxoglutarate dehydrogenase, E2 component, dihydrolipoamide succinyltransferase [uncultured Arcanobacterium sp.]
MAEIIKMPALGESVTEGTVTGRLKKVGEAIALDEAVLEVSTDKVDTEVPSPAAGVLAEIYVEAGETVAVGAELARIENDAAAPADSLNADTDANSEESATATPAAASPTNSTAESLSSFPSTPTAPPAPANSEAAAENAQTAPATAPISSAANNSARAYVTPIVRQLAKEKQVDLSKIEGSGVGGRIRRQDVLAAAARPTAAPAISGISPQVGSEATSVKAQILEKAAAAAALRGTKQKMTGVRKAIARHMISSLETSAQLTTVMEVDVTRLVQLRAKAKDAFYTRENTKLTYLPFFIKAATEALKAHPIINSSLVDEEIIYHDREHIGVAVDTEKGLYVPVIKNAGDLNIAGLSKAVADLAARTRSGKIDPAELRGSTFTVTNTGSIGALMDTPIINQPNVAILGTGVIHRAPGVVKDQDGNETISIRSKCYLCLSYDHRIIDGADASRYLRDVKLRLEEADFSAELGV